MGCESWETTFAWNIATLMILDLVLYFGLTFSGCNYVEIVGP